MAGPSVGGTARRSGVRVERRRSRSRSRAQRRLRKTKASPPRPRIRARPGVAGHCRLGSFQSGRMKWQV
ncbi:hypothetical protein [Lysobacter gummosus]|uniref:hypothetical protein n=1 Tax=Lysobacter gummosus TaxID=262324 RepID=UPI00364475DB